MLLALAILLFLTAGYLDFRFFFLILFPPYCLCSQYFGATCSTILLVIIVVVAAATVAVVLLGIFKGYLVKHCIHAMAQWALLSFVTLRATTSC